MAPTDEEVADYFRKTVDLKLKELIGQPLTSRTLAAIKANVATVLEDIKRMDHPVPAFRVSIDPSDPNKIWIEDEASYWKRIYSGK